MKSLLCLLTLLPLVLCIRDEYTFSSTLYDRDGDTYVIHWNFDATMRTISFAVNVSTTGWVGFGISPNGGMVNSDVVIGWVSNGRAYFHVSSIENINYIYTRYHARRFVNQYVDMLMLCGFFFGSEKN